MGKIIEITGPAGVGKTTILNALDKKWKENADWILKQKLFPRQKMNPLNISNLALNLPYLLKFGKTNLDNAALTKAGRQFVLQNGAYLDAYWNSLNTSYCRDINGYDSRFDSSVKFYSTIQKYQYVKDHSSNKYVLFDEGLVHHLAGRVPVKDNTLQDDNNGLQQLAQVMPLPAVLIYIDADVEVILERIACRKKVISMHKQDTEEVKAFIQKVKARMTCVKDILAEKGIPVLNIDSKEAISSNVKKICDFIGQLEEKKTMAHAI